MYTYATLVDIGVSEKHNDDRALINNMIVEEGSFSGIISEDYFVASICDGVGGLAKGYLAAEITLDFFKHLNRKNVSIEIIKKAVEEANRRVKERQIIEDMQGGMRTTIAGVYVNGEAAIVYNAGDSRVYRFRHKYLLQLSKDHSLVQDLVDLGQLLREDIKKHPKKNVINKCIGHDTEVNARVMDISGEYSVGDIVMICSDGITDYVDDSSIKDIILAHKKDVDLTACCKEIYTCAVEAGSLDNMSIILIRKDV